ncbi:MAG TPA: type II toxin-antitoxin system VapB family antitoxin [Thermoanaerobaculia bacterium]|nr:type II toxin-antitoxin system VapB family antitoxin [Thermoanaerobaculia bacterium]
MSSRKTSVEIDEELLAGARSILGTRTVRETIEQAFLEVVRARARREEVQALASLKGMDLANPEVMAGAWRK